MWKGWHARIRRPSPALVVALIALVVAVSGSAVAAIPGQFDGRIHACYAVATGELRVYDADTRAKAPRPRDACHPRSERPLQWPATDRRGVLGHAEVFSMVPGGSSALIQVRSRDNALTGAHFTPRQGEDGVICVHDLPFAATSAMVAVRHQTDELTGEEDAPDTTISVRPTVNLSSVSGCPQGTDFVVTLYDVSEQRVEFDGFVIWFEA